jgi:hypothetical protein
METAVQAFGSGYEAMRGVTEDIASKDILKQVYEGVSTDAAQTPAERQATYSKAAVLAGQKGLNSLSYSFQKQAGEAAKSAADTQLADIKSRLGRLDMASQLAQAAPDEQGLTEAVDAAGISTQEKMLFQRIIRDPSIPFEKKKEAIVKAGMTAKENADAQYKTLVGEARLSEAKTKEEDVLRKTKKDANAQANKTGPAGDEKALNKEIADLDKREASDLTKVETNPYVTDKDKAKANIKAEYEAKRKAARERRQKGEKEPKKSEFVEGQIYEDANGNKAKYSQGRWIPVK